MDRSWWRVLTKCGPLEKGMTNHFSILAFENLMNSMKSQKDWTLKDELPNSVGAQMLLEKSREIAPERMKRLNQSKNNAQLWM